MRLPRSSSGAATSPSRRLEVVRVAGTPSSAPIVDDVDEAGASKSPSRRARSEGRQKLASGRRILASRRGRDGVFDRRTVFDIASGCPRHMGATVALRRAPPSIWKLTDPTPWVGTCGRSGSRARSCRCRQRHAGRISAPAVDLWTKGASPRTYDRQGEEDIVNKAATSSAADRGERQSSCPDRRNGNGRRSLHPNGIAHTRRSRAPAAR